MKATLFRKVLTADRLPEQYGEYDTAYGTLTYVPYHKEWRREFNQHWISYMDVDTPNWWLEPVEVGKEEIIDILMSYVEDKIGETRPYIDPDAADQTAKDIIVLLK